MSEFRLALRLLGPFSVQLSPSHQPAAAATTLSRKTRALLAYLASSRLPLNRQTLAAFLFQEANDPLGALRWQLSQIRRHLGAEILSSHRGSVQMAHDLCWVDVDIFQSELDQDLAHLPAPRIEEALHLYRGEFLETLSLPSAPDFDLWLLAERARYRQLYAGGIAALVERQLARAAWEDALPWARRLVQHEPLDEEAHRRLIWLYARSGQREAALEHFDLSVATLRQELDLEPSEAFLALREQVLAGQIGAWLPGAGDPVPARSTSEPGARLPAHTTPFIGRKEELARLHGLLADPDTRLLTLLGPGGIGKTRLALRAAEALARGESGGPPREVVFVPLASTPAGYVPAEIATALGLSPGPGSDLKERLLAFLGLRETLLVLDNFDHLVAEARVLSEILTAAPGVTILVTSRARLNLYPESCLDLRGLSTPQQEADDDLESYDAYALFVARARRLDKQFAPRVQRSEIAGICRRLDGSPLAIELAAGWVRTHSCREILAEIERDVDFLATDMQDVPARQRSLRLTFSHSWRLLAAEDRALFARLSVFRDGFDPEAAAAVAGADRAGLARLADQSMIYRGPDGRYRLHELMRQLGEEQMTPAVAVDCRRRHCLYYASFVHQRRRHVLTAGQPRALGEIGVEFENIRSGWQWAVDHLTHPELAGTAAGALGQYAPMLSRFFRRMGRYHTGLRMFQMASATHARALGDRTASSLAGLYRRLGAILWTGEARLCYTLGQFADVQRLTEDSLQLLGDAGEIPLRVDALTNLGLACVRLGDLTLPRSGCERHWT